MTDRAVIYTRVSSKQQAGVDRTSLPEQLRMCREAAEKLGAEVVTELRDVAPGTNRKRKGYRRLCEMVASSQVDVVIAEAEDRLYRGLAVVGLYDAITENPKATVHLVTENFDRSMMAVKAGIAQKELEDLRRRVERGWRARLREGKLPPGNPKYGYRAGEDGRAEVNPEEAGTVRRIFELFLDGVPWLEIRDTLDAEGRGTRSGKRWQRAYLVRLVNGAAYYRGYDSYVREGVFEPETFRVPYPPIIDEGTWEASQALRAENRERYRGHHVKAPAILRGIARCAVHDKALSVRAGRMAYKCQHRDDHPEDDQEGCADYVKVRQLDAAVWRQVVDALLGDGQLEDQVRQQALAHAVDRQALEGEAARAQSRLDQIEEERQAVIRLARQSRISDDDLTLQLDELEVNRLHMARVLAEAEAALASAADPDQVAAAATRQFQALRDKLSSSPLARTITRAQFEDPDAGADWVASVLSEFGGDEYVDKYDGDKSSAAEWAVAEWQRTVLGDVLSAVLVRKDGNQIEARTQFRIGVGLPDPTPSNLVTAS